jgi:hypothetical protein
MTTDIVAFVLATYILVYYSVFLEKGDIYYLKKKTFEFVHICMLIYIHSFKVLEANRGRAEGCSHVGGII